MSRRSRQPQKNSGSRSAGLFAQPFRFSAVGGLALILVGTWLTYYPALHGGFLWDDEAHVTKPELRSLHGLHRIWFEAYRVGPAGQLLPGATQQYYPLLHSAFWLEHQLWGDHPLGYHMMNLLLHSGIVCLIFLIVRKLSIPGALLAAGIFALHPVQVESVAWITEQKNTLSGVFYLSAILAYLHFDESRKPELYIVALALIVCGLLSKTITATLPAAMLVIFWWRRGALSWKRDVQPLIPFFLLGAVAGLFTAWVERNLIGAEGASFELSLMERGILAGRVIWFYLGKLVWPTNLMFIYPRWKIDPADARAWLYPLAAIAATTALFVMRHRWRAGLAGWLLFVGTLFPVLGFFNVYPFLFSYVADHFQYLSSLAMIVLAAAGLALFVSRLRAGSRWIGAVLCLGLLAILATLSWQQAGVYSDAIQLYQKTIDKNPDCWMAHNNLGVQFVNLGRGQEAMECFEQALQIRPEYPEAHNNLGVELAEAGRLREAKEHYQAAIRSMPQYADAYYNLARLLLDEGRTTEAIENYRLAILYLPQHAKAHNNLGIALKRSGRWAEAIEEFRRSLELDSGSFESHYNLADALLHVGHPQEAIEQFQQALRYDPTDIDALIGLASSYEALHRSAEAIATGEKALELARAQRQTELAEKIAGWLTLYRSRQSNLPQSVPHPETVAPQK